MKNDPNDRDELFPKILSIFNVTDKIRVEKFAKLRKFCHLDLGLGGKFLFLVSI